MLFLPMLYSWKVCEQFDFLPFFRQSTNPILEAHKSAFNSRLCGRNYISFYRKSKNHPSCTICFEMEAHELMKKTIQLLREDWELRWSAIWSKEVMDKRCCMEQKCLGRLKVFFLKRWLIFGPRMTLRPKVKKESKQKHEKCATTKVS